MSVSRLSQSSVQNAFQKFNNTWDGRSVAIGSMDAIWYATLTTQQTSVTFNNIPQTYSHLQLRCTSKTSDGTGPSMGIRFNNVSDTGLYKSHYLETNGGGTTANGVAGNTNYAYIGYPTPGSANSLMFGCQIVDILDYTNANKNKTTRSLAGYDTNNTVDGYTDIFSSVWLKTDAITSITVILGAGENFAAKSTFSLYGIR